MAKSNVGFEFPPDTSQQWDGFNQPGMEHFSGSPFEHLGREVTQNALDAYSSYPVRIDIKLIQIPTNSIPDLKDLTKALEQCKLGAKDEGKKAEAFFEGALELLKKPKIGVLQIADYNTKGVAGPCINGKPFYAMMKATGQSKKASDVATGSYGIGKFAPFTVSKLRTVFLTTLWQSEDKKNWHHYVQGKSILMSHGTAKETRRGTGFWGIKNNCLPVESIDKLPDWLVRSYKKGQAEKSAGTTLSILGFEGGKDWKNILAANIAENFFGAIQRGELEVYIEDTYEITTATLASIFASKEIVESLRDQKDEPEKFNNVQSYFEALTSTETITETTQNAHLGLCELKILMKEGLPKKIAFLRNGMLITDELRGLKRFGDFKEFSAVLECQSTKGKELLRAMEPPRHDDFEPDRLLTKKEQQHARVALQDLTKWVREMLKRHAQDPISEVTNIDELADFFGDEDELGKGKRSEEENPVGKIIIRARPIPKSKITIKAETEDSTDSGNGGEGIEGTGDGNGDGQGGKGKGKGQNNTDGGNSGTGGGGSDNDPKPNNSVIGLQNVRAIPLSASKRTIAFTPSISGEVNLILQDSGADQNYPIAVISTTKGKINSGKIEGLSVISGERFTFEVELDHDFDGTLRVVANAV